MKTIIQLAIALTLLTGAVQGGRAAVKHYSFVDAVQEAMLFASSRTEDQIADKVMEIAGDYQIPLDPNRLSVQRLPFQIDIEAPYTEQVNLLPGIYSRPWDFTAAVHVRLLEDTRPRIPTPRAQRPRR